MILREEHCMLSLEGLCVIKLTVTHREPTVCECECFLFLTWRQEQLCIETDRYTVLSSSQTV